MYYSTKQSEERDQQKAVSNIEEELTKLQNNSSKNNSNDIVEFIQKASKLQRLDLASKVII